MRLLIDVLAAGGAVICRATDADTGFVGVSREYDDDVTGRALARTEAEQKLLQLIKASKEIAAARETPKPSQSARSADGKETP